MKIVSVFLVQLYKIIFYVCMINMVNKINGKRHGMRRTTRLSTNLLIECQYICPNASHMTFIRIRVFIDHPHISDQIRRILIGWLLL